MRVAILESIIMPAGHEVEFDRIIVDELKKQGHSPCFFVPKNFIFKVNYKVNIEYLAGGEIVTYAGAGKIKKIWLSVLREKRRLEWFNSAYEKACQGLCDAIVIPTATYRYLRTVHRSKLKNSPVPVIFIFHGINPKEKSNFEKQAKACEKYKNIYLKVITLRNDLKQDSFSNLALIKPPVFKPTDLKVDENIILHNPVKIGFFGQFRKEKNLGFFLQVFEKAKFNKPVKLIVQGATATPEDSDVFEKYIKDYSRNGFIEFWHKNLIGKDWQEALLSVDVIIMPYAAERYRYHWSAMLFTAIGFYKPVLQSPEMNPEVLQKYNIGQALNMQTEEAFTRQLENFVNNLDDNVTIYEKNLRLANIEYSHEKLIRNILTI